MERLNKPLVWSDSGTVPFIALATSLRVEPFIPVSSEVVAIVRICAQSVEDSRFGMGRFNVGRTFDALKWDNVCVPMGRRFRKVGTGEWMLYRWKDAWRERYRMSDGTFAGMKSTAEANSCGPHSG